MHFKMGPNLTRLSYFKSIQAMGRDKVPLLKSQSQGQLPQLCEILCENQEDSFYCFSSLCLGLGCFRPVSNCVHRFSASILTTNFPSALRTMSHGDFGGLGGVSSWPSGALLLSVQRVKIARRPTHLTEKDS